MSAIVLVCICNCWSYALIHATSGEEIHAHRGGDDGGARTACAHRTRPVEESLAEFVAMKDGKYQPGEAVLRMKQDLEDGNPQMWDLAAYRVLDVSLFGNLSPARSLVANFMVAETALPHWRCLEDLPDL